MTQWAHLWTYMDPARLQQADWIRCASTYGRCTFYKIKRDSLVRAVAISYRAIKPFC
jgi:hypothetical protein